jgi:hypothetical protein
LGNFRPRPASRPRRLGWYRDRNPLAQDTRTHKYSTLRGLPSTGPPTASMSAAVNTSYPCYWRSGSSPDVVNPTAANVLSPCGPVNSTNPVVSCCFAGETCMSDGICHYKSSKAGLAGYRVAACTDSTYKDPLCKVWCGTSPRPGFSFMQPVCTSDLPRSCLAV